MQHFLFGTFFENDFQVPSTGSDFQVPVPPILLTKYQVPVPPVFYKSTAPIYDYEYTVVLLKPAGAQGPLVAPVRYY